MSPKFVLVASVLSNTLVESESRIGSNRWLFDSMWTRHRGNWLSYGSKAGLHLMIGDQMNCLWLRKGLGV